MSIINDDPNMQRMADTRRGISQIVNSAPSVKKIEVDDGPSMPKEGLKPLHEQKAIDIDAALADNTPGTAHFDNSPAEEVDFSKYMEKSDNRQESAQEQPSEKALNVDEDDALDFIETPIEDKKAMKKESQTAKNTATKELSPLESSSRLSRNTKKEDITMSNSDNDKTDDITIDPERAFDESNQELFGVIHARINSLRSERDELIKRIDELEDRLIELQRKNTYYVSVEKYELIDDDEHGKLLDEMNKLTRDLNYKNRLISRLSDTIGSL